MRQMKPVFSDQWTTTIPQRRTSRSVERLLIAVIAGALLYIAFIVGGAWLA